MILVGISGKAHSGKTTLAQYLTRYYGCNHVSLASVLKEKAKAEFGLTEYQVNGPGKEEATSYRHSDQISPFTAREILIRLGMLYRSIDKDFWIKQVGKQLMQSRVNVISDIRFVNEADWIKRMGGLLVRLERHESLTGPHINDNSEKELDNYPRFDLVISALENIGPTDIPLMADKVQKLVMGYVNAQTPL